MGIGDKEHYDKRKQNRAASQKDREKEETYFGHLNCSVLNIEFFCISQVFAGFVASVVLTDSTEGLCRASFIVCLSPIIIFLLSLFSFFSTIYLSSIYSYHSYNYSSIRFWL